MPQKNILAIMPATPNPSYNQSILSPLDFLHEEYHIHPIDSLSIMDDLPNEVYYRLWRRELIPKIPHYDAFFGFSLGGVILQQCFSLFAATNKPIVLFSTPSFADKALSRKLAKVIAFYKENKLNQAFNSLYPYVYYPNKIPEEFHPISLLSKPTPVPSTVSTQEYSTAVPFGKKPLVNETHAAQRMIYGLTRVLETNSTKILKETSVNYLHLIGECSQLVNINNVIAAPQGLLLQVPGAGMRVLDDNLPYCKKAILEILESTSNLPKLI